MPPRFVYWTIIAGGLPTAFRAAGREELLPTFKRIQEKHPDAAMKYFARGKLWDSAEEAKQEADARRARAPRPEARGRDWRPGGEHRDPRQPFKDAKKKRNLEWRKERFERRQRATDTPPLEKPHGDPLRAPAGRPPGRDRFRRDQREAGARPGEFRPRKSSGDRQPFGDRKRFGDRKPSGDRKASGDRKPFGDRKASGDRTRFGGRKPAGPPGDRKPGGPRREFKPGAPERDVKPGGPLRDRRRRG
jgi:hypothetical protein